MPSTDIDTLSARPGLAQQAEFISQVTAVEQARAVAEVQAAVVVAQQVPRDLTRAEADMRDACGRLGLAGRAFYQVTNRGSGPSVHLARELARVWGNVQYGVHELRRDDDAGMSEIQAFAWDVQTNTRSTRTFQVPHQRMKRVNGRPTRDKLIDLTDVYLNNQNIGARAVRECIFTVLPAWFTDEAQTLCRQTLERGENGQSHDQRVEAMIKVFKDLGVSQRQIEDRVGRKRGQWSGADLADLRIVYSSIKSRDVSVDDEFPTGRVTAGEVAETAASRPAAAPANDDPGAR